MSTPHASAYPQAKRFNNYTAKALLYCCNVERPRHADQNCPNHARRRKKKYLNNVTHFSSNEKRKRNETAKCFNKMSPNATPPNEMSPNQIASIGPLTKGSKTKLLDAVVRSQVAFTQPPRMGSPRFRQKYEVFSMLACSLDPTKPPNAPIKCLNKMLQGCVFSRT